MKIHNKLFLMLFSFSLLLVSALVILMQWSISRGMIDYVNTKEIEAITPLIPTLKQQYNFNNSWESLQDNHQLFGLLIVKQLRKNDNSITSTGNDKSLSNDPSFDANIPPRTANNLNKRPRPPAQAPDDFPLRLHAAYALLDANGKLVAGRYLDNIEYSKTPILINNIIVGYFAISKHKQIGNGYELDFINQQQQYLWIIALIVMFLVVLLTFPLAHHLVEPIKQIIGGMHQLTQGQYDQHIALKRKDEIGDLIRDFNELSITLNKNENTRKRWLANISHELRTPIAILRGELEAMIDGVRPLNKANIESANDEVKHLQYLIDDLHQLTSADIGGMHYRKQQQDFSMWLNTEVKKHESYLFNAGILLQVEIESTPIELFFDSSRLCQLFDNLFNNCVKYSQANLVKISMSCNHQTNSPEVTIKVEDNGVGVDEQHLTNLFEYLYRVEDSRNRKTGGSGLGLSICAHIVAAHQGHIVANKSSLGGLAIEITLPY